MIEVLSIEDDSGSRKAMQRLFAERGKDIRLSFAADHHEGLRALAQTHYDVVLLDLIMPGAPDAATLVQHVVDVGRAPVIVVSGIPEEQDQIAKLCLLAGASEYFDKAHIKYTATIEKDPDLLLRVIRKVHDAEQGRKATEKRRSSRA